MESELKPISDHLEILEMIRDGLFGSPLITLTNPKRASEWPQIRSALEKAIEEIKEYRRIKKTKEIWKDQFISYRKPMNPI